MAPELHLVTDSADETRAVGATVAGALRPGDLVALTGELGAGKTCFVQGAAPVLGVTDVVTSPSFVLRRDYVGAVCPVLHLDVYRLETLQDVFEVGYDDAVDGSRVTFIEWGDAMAPLLPPSYLEVEFRLAEPASDDGDERRRLLLRPRGDDWLRRFPGLRADLQRWAAEQESS